MLIRQISRTCAKVYILMEQRYLELLVSLLAP